MPLVAEVTGMDSPPEARRNPLPHELAFVRSSLLDWFGGGFGPAKSLSLLAILRLDIQI